MQVRAYSKFVVAYLLQQERPRSACFSGHSKQTVISIPPILFLRPSRVYGAAVPETDTACACCCLRLPLPAAAACACYCLRLLPAPVTACACYCLPAPATACGACQCICLLLPATPATYLLLPATACFC